MEVLTDLLLDLKVLPILWNLVFLMMQHRAHLMFANQMARIVMFFLVSATPPMASALTQLIVVVTLLSVIAKGK
jgi:hypothetical protein